MILVASIVTLWRYPKIRRYLISLLSILSYLSLSHGDRSPSVCYPPSSDAPRAPAARMASHWPLLLLAVAGAAAVTTTNEQPRSRKKPAWSGRLATYSIASVARREQRSDWNEVTQGNKIVLPRSVYDTLVSRGVSYKQFQIINPEDRAKKLFTGPLDFCAADGLRATVCPQPRRTSTRSTAPTTAPTLTRRVLPPQLGDEAAQAQGGRSLRGGDVPQRGHRSHRPPWQRLSHRPP